MNHQPEPEEPVEAMLKKAFEQEPPENVQHTLQSHLAHFRTRVQAREYMQRPRWYSQRFILRTAAGVGLAAVLMLGVSLGLLGSPAPTWAEVVERFAGTPCFSATIYVKDHATADPVQLELWMAQGGKLRLRVGNQMIFGEKGKVIETIPLTGSKESSNLRENARLLIEQYVEALGALDTFSLETLLKALPFNGVLSSPLKNENAGVSNDVVAFDISTPENDAWIRIWALRESRLPMRLLFWMPGTGESIDAVLSYFDNQSPEFFDPNAFKAAMEYTMPDSAGAAYLLFKDPGGRPVTPKDVQEMKPNARAPETS